ncbi:hypothetical protein [Rhizobium tumorigenes]|uniref:hypothetical protein n=1 Tax=Rhizobium tumorigenes TaxID=2041385 RepID=UPI00241C861E|nr:hypothetical protein [Rhizobium tumorigenes]WFS02790.1 hypothetical protein PR016_09385 [Rhizobium tumorigenes]
MTRRIKKAEREAGYHQASVKAALLTIVTDSTAPRDPYAKMAHYKAALTDAHRVIEILQIRNGELEQKLEKSKRDAEYWLGLCVPRSTAEKARLDGFRLARGKAAIIAEPGGYPNNLSEEIFNMPEPKARWTN